MNPIVIHSWGGAKRTAHFVGFNRDYSGCFLRDADGARCAIRHQWPKLYDLQFHRNPIQEAGSPLVSITRTALHVPPCFASKEEAVATLTKGAPEAVIALNSEPWKLVSF